VLPREGHLEQVFRIFVHFKKYHNTEFYSPTISPNISPITSLVRFPSKDPEDAVYLSIYIIVLSRVSLVNIRTVYRDPAYKQTAADSASFFGRPDNVNEVDKTTTSGVEDVLLHL
jgi:hypothetical protein